MLLVDPDDTEAITVFCLFVFDLFFSFSTGLFIRFCDYMCSPGGLDATLPVVSLE